MSNTQWIKDDISNKIDKLKSENDKIEIAEYAYGASETSSEKREEQAKYCVLFDDYKEEINKYVENYGKKIGLTTGIDVIDDMTMGLAPGELIVVAGSTSSGKTMTALNMIASLMDKGHTVGLISLEDAKGDTGSKLMRLMDNPDNKLNLIANDADSMEWEAVETFTRNAINDAEIEILFIDHLHYFARSTANQAEELGIVTKEFKRIAMTYKIPIVLISHTRKSDIQGVERDTTMNDLRGSSYIAQDADIVIMVNKIKENDNSKKDVVYRNDKLKLTLNKNRNRFCVNIGTSWDIDKNGIKFYRHLNSEQKRAWDMNKPQQKPAHEIGFSSHVPVQHGNSTVFEPKTSPTPQNLRNSGTSETPSNVTQQPFSDLI